MNRFLVLATSLGIIGAPVSAQPTAAADAQATPAAAPTKPKKVCRSTIMTGRRIAQRQCYTAAQWADYDRTQNEAAKKLVSDVTAAGGKSDLRPGANGLSTSAVFGLGQ